MIKINNVTKFFQTGSSKKYILKNVNLVIPEKKNIAILGRNGAGKSTFLNMLAGADFPTGGEITSDKSFSWPMGLQNAFQGSMTGRENVKFVCRIYGKNGSAMKSIIESVIEFSELKQYFDMPIKSYSSGMKSRLSFSLSLAFDFDYLIIDEILSVGDENFRKKSSAALKKKIKSCNILIVSHAMDILRELCDAGVVINDGKLVYYDNIIDAINEYLNINLSEKKYDASPEKITGTDIHCSDGNVFKNYDMAAKHYKIRAMSIIQALDQNNGSNVFLKKVFYRNGLEMPEYQEWYDIEENKTIISSDGVVFQNSLKADEFYIERMPEKGIKYGHVEEILSSDGASDLLEVQFYYLSEYK